MDYPLRRRNVHQGPAPVNRLAITTRPARSVKLARGATREDGMADDDGEPTMVELLDKASRRVTAALLMAGALIAIAVYARPSPPHYSVAAADGRVVRVDTRTGAMISCGAEGCLSVHRSGGHIDLHASLPKPAVPATTPAPAPAALPAPQPAAPAKP